MDEKTKSLIIQLGSSRIKHMVSMKPYTSARIGGPAELFYVARSAEELTKAIRVTSNLKLPYYVIGGGTNIILSDKGFSGLVIKNESRDIKIRAFKGKVNSNKTQLRWVLVQASSGLPMNHLVRYTINNELSGLEYFLGQPGTVGGAVYINAHNMQKGVYFGDFVHSADVLTRNGNHRRVSQSYFNFDYDQSILQTTGEIVLSVNLLLQQRDPSELWKKARLALQYRQDTQPIGIPSSGCTFRNFSKADAIRLGTLNHTCSAGYLLDKVGLKGYRIGDAMFSSKHANFILNCGNASGTDMIELIKEAKKRVKTTFNVNLKEEVVIL